MEDHDPRGRLRAWLLTNQPPTPADAPDAERLIEAAHVQGLGGLLAAQVRESVSWSGAPRERLTECARVGLVRATRQLGLVARLQDALLRRGLRALPLKGAALIERVYDSPAERFMSDVDLLALDDWPTSVRVLEEDGLRLSERAEHAWAFSDPSSGATVELHRSVTSCLGLFPLDREGLWERSVPGCGQVSRLPSAEDLLVQLALHAAFQHGLVLSLVQHLDLRRVLERLALDGVRLATIARAARAQPALDAALLVTTALVGGPSLQPATTPRPTSFSRWLMGRLDQPLAFVTPARPALARVRWGLAPGQRLRLIQRTLVPAAASPPASVISRCFQAGVRVWRLLRHRA